MILPYQHIRTRCIEEQLVRPWAERTTMMYNERALTYGLGPSGYDVRLGKAVELAPGGFELSVTFERFNMPDDLMAQVCDKSSWARRGLFVQNTVIEPGWRGYLTLELTNHSPDWLILHYGWPIAQIVFMQLAAPTTRPYEGKYQDQGPVPTPAR